MIDIAQEVEVFDTDRQVAIDNPCLRMLPTVPSQESALKEMTRGRFVRDWNGDEATRPVPSDICIGNEELAALLIDTIRAVRASYGERNLADPEFSLLAKTAVTIANFPEDEDSRLLMHGKIAVPGATPKGLLVVAQSRMGRRVWADILHDKLGRKVQPIRVMVDGRTTGFWMLPVWRTHWPSNGSLRKFVRTALRDFDSATSLAYGRRPMSHFLRDEKDGRDGLNSLAIAYNVGLLIVERINAADASSDAAREMWDFLGRFTRKTGVPVLCLATPGAVAALSEQSTAVGELTSSSMKWISPAAKDSRRWTATAGAIFDAYLRRSCFQNSPAWFNDVLWEQSLGLHGLAANICKYIDRKLKNKHFESLDSTRFIALAHEALVLEQPHLEVVKQIGSKKRFSKVSVRRHGDWLPLAHAMATVPRLVVEHELKLSS